MRQGLTRRPGNERSGGLTAHDTETEIDATRSGRTGIIRVTAKPTWTETVLVPAAARFHERYPAIELRIETATRA